MIGGHEHNRLARALMPDVARKLLGDPPRHTAREWRYGRKGSFRVDIEKGTWKDFESDKGGGVIGLVRQEFSLDRSKAVKWLIQEGFLEKCSPRMPQNQRTALGPAPLYYSPTCRVDPWEASPPDGYQLERLAARFHPFEERAVPAAGTPARA